MTPVPKLDGAADAFRLGVYALARLKSYDALAASVLTPDGQPRLQWWPVAYALQRIEDKRALPALLTLARAENAYTRAFAVKGLGALRDPSAVACPAAVDRCVARGERAGHRSDSRHGAHRRCARRAGIDQAALHARPRIRWSARKRCWLWVTLLRAVSVDAFVDFLGDPSADRQACGAAGFREARRRHVPHRAVGTRSRCALERPRGSGHHPRLERPRTIAARACRRCLPTPTRES